jgi:hypothetical protein
MKNRHLPLMIAALFAVSFFFTACNKQAELPAATPATGEAQLTGAISATSDQLAAYPVVTVSQTEQQFMVSVEKGRVPVRRLSPSAFTAIDIIDINPWVNCNSILQQQYNSIYPSAQAAANQCCCPVRFCIGTPQCGYYMYMVRPNVLCPIDVLDYTARVNAYDASR